MYHNLYRVRLTSVAVLASNVYMNRVGSASQIQPGFTWINGINKEAAKLTSGSFLARKLKTKWRKFILISILTVIIVFFYGFNLLIQMYSFFNSYCIEYKLETLGTYCGFIGFGSTTCAQDSVSAVSVLFLIYRDPALTIIIQLFFNI